MKISIIAAMTSNSLIGTETGLPWDIPVEYDHYLHIVKDKSIIMGRRTYEIFGSDLDPKKLIVVTSKRIGGLKCATDFHSSLEIARNIGDEVFVAGGRSIYAEGLKIADEMHLSEIKGSYEGTIYFPHIDYSNWIEKEKYDYAEFVYRRLVRK